MRATQNFLTLDFEVDGDVDA